MRGRACIAVAAFGALLILFGILVEFRPDLAATMVLPFARPSLGPITLGALLLFSALFEGRYRGSGDPALGPDWEKTAETFRDEESGQWLQVWCHRSSGERRYLAADRAT